MLVFGAPGLLLAAAALGFWRPGRAGMGRLRLIEALSFSAFALAVFVAVQWVRAGGRAQIVPLVMLLLVSFIGWVVVRFSVTYLYREPLHGRFMAWLCATLSMVLLLVTADNVVQLVLAWVATSLCLHELLLFYPERAGARRAARKKFVTARAADAALILAAGLLAYVYHTADIAAMLAAARAGQGGMVAEVAAALLALAAMLKSAQFPLHGWLTEVMEAPAPVSALLHAGVINAGGFVLIRFADVMLLAPVVLAALVMVGGFTALFGGLVMLTQPAVKNSLAWSTVAQMGFMILQCGLALFPLALLHLVAHSLYKAHSFLASGDAVERIAAGRRPGPVAVPDARAVGRAFLAALAIYGLIGFGFDIYHKSPQALALGAMLIFGVAYLFAQGLADTAPMALSWRMAAYAVLASVAYFTLHGVAFWLTAGVLPHVPAPGGLQWALMALTVTSFGLVAAGQAMFPLWAYHPAAAGLRVHLSNGLYANALFDRALGLWLVRGAR